MSNIHPYAPIEKTPLFTEDAMQSKGFTVRIQANGSEDGWEEVGIVSEDYLLIPNKKVRDLAEEITGRTGNKWETTKQFFDGRRFALGLTMDPNGERKEVKEGDALSLGLLFENSYDGSRRLSCMLFANRLVCSNGMVSPEHFHQLTFRHSPSSQGWEKEIRRTLSMLEHAEEDLTRFTSAARHLAETPFSSKELQEVRSEYLGSLPVTVWGKVMDAYLTEEEHTGWGLLNAATRILWHRDRSFRDFSHNQSATEGLLAYANERNGTG